MSHALPPLRGHARFVARPEAADALAAAMASAIVDTRAEAGNLGLDMFRSIAAPNIFFLMSSWRDEAALAHHYRQPYLAEFRLKSAALEAETGSVGFGFEVDSAGAMALPPSGRTLIARYMAAHDRVDEVEAALTASLRRWHDDGAVTRYRLVRCSRAPSIFYLQAERGADGAASGPGTVPGLDGALSEWAAAMCDPVARETPALKGAAA